MLHSDAIRTIVQRIVHAAHAPRKVILFGSYANDSANEHSDLDLLVVEKEVPHMPSEYNRLRGAIGPIGIGVDVLIYKSDEFEKRKNWQTSPVFDAVRTGKVMYEYDAG
uniref:Nucleotidyltransferase domain-containing protein n=1 Tax=Candidatus Kentrum sp. TUN TaxID=2126343 RepID=A0A450ZM74_9GAMM|nr:MAG: Nucleotidyltransferase domain-containing protein [Candidatus Kentron sp. TUN]VFK54862.1 MAG: Nucleotidyltransferase domain-containing protein [Candidatus Kentron sp. TUN]VFK60166.1 MAG: Nucleotidyltransferase domain-containing protein [Candidatus Kentron sp. TUN]